MKKDEKKNSTGRTICTRSLAASTAASLEQETTHGLRRSNRGTPSTKPITPAYVTRKSERLAPSPASATKLSARMEKTNTPSPLPRSDKKKNVSSQSSKGSDHSSRNAETSSDVKQGKDNKKNNIQESANQIKKRVPMMSARSYRALFRGKVKESEALVDASSPPPANLESKRLPGCQTSLDKGTDVPLKSVRDTENMVPDASAMVETGDDRVIDLPSENSETQKLLVSKTSIETNIDFPLKRKRDTSGTVLDANGDDQIMSSDDKNQLETCNACGKRQKVNSDFESLSVCSCIAQPVEESDHVAQETEPATSRDYEKNRQMLHGKSSNPKFSSSMYPEYWVPVQLSDVQLEQYCRTLLSKSLSLSSLSKNDLGALEETLNSVRKTCDHPYVMDASLKQLLTKNLELHKILDVEIEASGKLHLLDAMLTHIKKNGLKAVVFYQATQSPEGLLLGNILEDFVGQRFGPKSYEHGIYSSKKNAINNFNKESQCCVLLLETRACSQTIKLLRAEAFIIFGSSLNPSQDVKHLEKIKVESYSEKTKIFRLYSVCTVEEKGLILARQTKPVENLNRPLTHALLMWGASYLFDRLDHFHGSETPDSKVAFEQSIMDGVIHEFSSILSSKGGEENEGKLCLLLEAKHAQGTYSSDSTLFGEEYIKLSDEDSPKIFWTKLLGGKNPKWKYPSDTPQRNRKRVQYFEGSEESPKIGDGGNTKKRKKASDDVSDPPVDNDERKASGKDHMGALESPKVIAVQSSCKSTSGADGTLDGNDAFGFYSMGGHISGIPKDILAGHDWRKISRESLRRLHAVLKPEMAKLGKVLQLSEACTSMVENILEYVIDNHRIYEEPTATLQAFKIALSWIAALLVKQNLCHKESLVRVKSELAFSCSRVEVNYIFSILCCMKSLFLECTKGLQKAMHSSSAGEECMTEKRCSHYSTATKDIENTISYIKKKCKKQVQKLVQEHEERKVELLNMYAEKKRKLETRKKLEAAVIRITCSRTSTQVDDLKRLDHDFEKKFDEIKSEKNECLKSLEQMHEAAKKKLAEDEGCWISRIKNWAQAELQICVPIKSGNNKNLCGICSSNTSIISPDVQTWNDANVEATYADTNCMASIENQVPEAENTSGTLPSDSTQPVHELVGSRNDKAMDVSTLSREQPTDNEATKRKSSEHASIAVPDIHAGCQEEFASVNMHMSEYQICDSIVSAAPDEDVSSRLSKISQSFASLAKSTYPECSLNRDEALVTIENNRTSHVVSDADNILEQQNEETSSLDKERPDELVLPMPHPESVVVTRGSAKSDQDDQDICLLSSSPAEKQPAPARNTQGKNNEAAIEPLSAGSEAIETTDITASDQGDQVTCPLPSSPAGNQHVPEANIEDQNIINTSAVPYVVGPDALESGDYTVSNQETVGAQDACSLPSALVGTQSNQGANIEGQDITTEAQLPTEGSDAVETVGGSPVSDQGAQDASPLTLSSPGNHPDTAGNIEGPNNTTVAEPYTTGSDACEMEMAEPDPQSHTTRSDACEMEMAEPDPQSHTTGSDACEMEIAEPDPQSHTTGSDACEMERAEPDLQSLTTGSDACEMEIAEPDPQPNTTGSDACEMEIAEPDPQVERSTFAREGGMEPSAVVTAPVPSFLSNGMGQTAVNEGGLEPSAVVTAPVPSLLSSGMGQVQPVPQIPFPVFSDPFLHELEKLRRESENSKKSFEEKKSLLKAELERKMAEVQAEFQRKFSEVESEHNTRTMEIETNKNLVIMNKLLANAFLSKCTDKKVSSSAAPMGRIQQLAQRAAQVSALRNYTTPAPALLQLQASAFPSSVPRSTGPPLNSTVCPMPHPRQPLVSNTSPTPSASPATHSVASAILRSPAPHFNPYRPPCSTPVATAATLTLSSPPQALTYSAVLIQQQQQQQNLSSGLQGNNDVVCLSDDE